MKRLWISLSATYFTIVLGFLLFQRNLIFHPTPLNGTTPRNYSLAFENVFFKTPDGVTLNGWWVQHPQHDPKRPVLLYCHGNAANLSLLAQVTKIFYDFGFDEFLFDYRGYGDSGKGAGGLNEKAVETDALAAYQWLRAKGFPEDHILIWGHSLGSSIAAWLASQTHPAGLVLEGAFPSVYAMSREKYPLLLVFPFLIQDKFETERYVRQRTCPLLMLHAEKDTIVPLRLGQKVFEEAPEPKQWKLIEGINHNSFPDVAYRYEGVILDFAKKCMNHEGDEIRKEKTGG